MIVIPVGPAVRGAATRALRHGPDPGTRPAKLGLAGPAARGRLGGLMALALALAACSSATAPGATILASTPRHDTLVVLPLNVTVEMPAELEVASPEVVTALRDYLRSRGAALKTVSYPVARKLWLQSIRDAQTAARARASHHPDAGFDDAALLFVQELSEHAEFDAVIVPSLFVQQARVEGISAHWDGAEQELQFQRGRDVVAPPEEVTIEGAVPAASLHAVVLDAEGHKLQEHQAGLSLLVRVRMGGGDASAGSPFTFAPIEQPFADRALVTAGIARALAPFLPGSPAGAPSPAPSEDGVESAPRS